MAVVVVAEVPQMDQSLYDEVSARAMPDGQLRRAASSISPDPRAGDGA